MNRDFYELNEKNIYDNQKSCNGQNRDTNIDVETRTCNDTNLDDNNFYGDISNQEPIVDVEDDNMGNQICNDQNINLGIQNEIVNESTATGNSELDIPCTVPSSVTTRTGRSIKKPSYLNEFIVEID